jgi:hypothetical protein
MSAGPHPYTEEEKVEDTAAVLRGLVKCENCDGTGEVFEYCAHYEDDPGYYYICEVCRGRRYIKPEEAYE